MKVKEEFYSFCLPMVFLFNCRAQDKAAMQLSELEEEMDHRIQAAENRIKKEVSSSFIFSHFYHRYSLLMCVMKEDP